MYAEVCFPFFINQTFSYYVPLELRPKIIVGCFVQVKFRSKISKGLIASLSPTTSFKGNMNNIISIDFQNTLPKELWQTLQWMEDYYVTPIGKIMQVTLSWVFKKNIKTPKKVKHIQLSEAARKNNQLLNDLTKNQQIFIDYLLKQKFTFIPLIDLNKELKSPYNIYKQLKKKNVIIEESKIKSTQGNNASPLLSIDKIILTKKQNNIYNSINKNFKKSNKPHFLHGITGSGKTEIYLKLVYDFFSKGKSCLVLVPEIALSSQIYARFKEYFGVNVLLWHSKMSEPYKRDTWIQMNNKRPLIIIGPRSALFSPVHNLGLLIIDEEHDTSYKESEKQPSYNARDMAVIRGRFSGGMVLLGSATPSLETYYNTIIEKYHLYKLNERYGESVLPTVQLINMSNISNAFILKPILSQLAINQIKETLNKNEQILILHNRRGFASLRISDKSDGVLKCERCDIILTFHQHSNELICHHCYCKYSIKFINQKYNNPEISYSGYGTEQLELLINKLFPKAIALRMDADSATSMHKQVQILNQFKKGDADILLGTQMIAKGLDFDNITLVIVVNADLGALIPNFKSHEKMFQLIYQVIGRAGRSNKKSKALIQTYQPNSKIIQMATNYELKKFYNLQLKNREDLGYPPFTRLIRIIFSGPNFHKCKHTANKIFYLLNKTLHQFLIGPLPCPIEKLSNKSRYHIIIKAPHSKFKFILKKINDVQNKKESLISKEVNMLIDIDANSVL